MQAAAAESWNVSAVKNAVISSLAAVHTHPPTASASLCPFALFIREYRSISSRSRVDRKANSQLEPQEVLEALLGFVPVCWQTLSTCQTANMLKMLPLQRSVVALHYIIKFRQG